jgi:hypothetical protein
MFLSQPLIVSICASDRVMMDGGSGSHGNGHRGRARAASAERLRLSRVQ